MSREALPRPRVARWVALLVVASLALATPAPAFASKVTDMQAQAAAVQRQIDALDNKTSIADEDYNQARDRFSQLDARARAASREVAVLTARKAVLQTSLDSRVDQLYRGGGTLGMLGLLLGSRDLSEFTWMSDVLDRLSEQDAAIVAELKKTEAAARRTQATLVASRADAARAEKTMASNAAAVRAQLAARQQVLDGLSADIKTLIAQEQARKAAAARRAYLAYLARHRTPPRKSSGRKSTTWLDLSGNPPASARAATAVAWAQKALGRRYLWAASGPTRFDCSGLTMWAYSHAGVHLPHSSRAQINCGRRVSRPNLQPGDLVFFYSPIHHVGMYVGGGYFIEAPHAGGVVQYTSLASYGRFAGACRP